MSHPPELRRFDTLHVGRVVHIHDALPSTNDLAAAMALSPEHDGALVVARHQTAGRGQHGRVWQSRPGDSLLLSVVLHPPELLRRPVVLTAWAAVAIGEAVRVLTGVQARIKWPNDLLVHGKKVCGILIEQAVGGATVRSVVGIGLNLNQTAEHFAAATLPDAGSLRIAKAAPVDWDEALKTVVEQLDFEYTRLVQGETVPLEADWKWRIGLLGRTVRVELADGTDLTGRLREMSFDGIELEYDPGGFRAVAPELIRHIFAA